MDFKFKKFDKKTTIIIASIIIVLIIIIVGVIIGISSKESYSIGASKICETDNCKKVNELLKKFVDKTADPCEDFYSFVCGSFLKKSTLPGYNFIFHYYSADSMKELAKEISKPIGNSDRRMAVLGKKFYQNCIYSEKPFENKNTHIYNLIKEINGGEKLSIIDSNWSDENFDWTKLYKNAFNAGLTLTSVVTTRIQRNGDTIIGSPIIKSPVESNIIRVNILNILKDNLGNVDETYFNQQYADAYEMYREIYNVSSHSRHLPVVIKTSEEFAKDCPGIDWLKVANVGVSENVAKKNTDEILFLNQDYLCKLPTIFKDRKKTISNYILIMVLEELVAEYFVFHPLKEPLSEQKHKNCIYVMKNTFGIALSYMYMKLIEEKEGIQFRAGFGREVNQTIIPELIKVVGEEATWYSQKVRDMSVDKIKNTKVFLGYLAATNDSIDTQIEFYENIYNNLNLTTNTIQNILNINAINNLELSKYKIVPTEINAIRDMSMNYVLEANAFYTPTYAVIHYPILGFKYYQDHALQFYNFGNLFATGHELGHGFGIANYIYDKTSTSNTNYWDKKSEKEFHKRFKCIIEEYNKEMDPCVNQYVNGTFTAEENHADYIGGKLTSRTFQRLLDEFARKNIIEERLPDFQEYSPKQMFWVTAVLPDCRIMTESECRLLHQVDIHTIPTVRGNMKGKLSEDFANDWNCRPGQKMYHPRKCQTY